MPIEPVKIPQNVYIEDRIVGPLTLRQTLIMAGGGGFSYALWAILNKAYGGLPIVITVLVWLPALLAAIFALVKINDLSLVRICFLLLERVNKPSVRTWAPRRGISINIRSSLLPMKEEEEQTRKKREAALNAAERTHEKIEQLSSLLDAGMAVDEETPSEQPSESPDATAHRFPVDKSKIAVDQTPEHPRLSDLSVFRDIFPGNSSPSSPESR